MTVITKYKDLKVGDIIIWYGARERIIAIENIGPTSRSKLFYQGEDVIYFTLEPADKKAEKILGKFYANGEYGGVGCLEVKKEI